jgi:hypothetical protein
MATRNTLYKRLFALGACQDGAYRYKGKYFKEVWDTMENESQAQWLILTLCKRGYMQHPDVEKQLWGVWNFKQGSRLYNAYMFGYPKTGNRYSRGIKGKVCVDAMKACVSFRQLSRALSKVKVDG